MHRILLIDDDAQLGPPLAIYFQRFELELTHALRPSEGLAQLAAGGFDAAILDVMLPEMDGFELCRTIRKQGDLPIVMLTARGDVMDRVVGLELGADDYLPKPFSMIELRVRIEAILRRVALDRRPLPSLAPLRDDLRPLRFDDELCDVFYQEQWAGLTRSEYRLLETLHRNGEEVLSKAFLYQHVLQRGYAPHDRSLDMHISQIRRKLKAVGYSEREVRTVWGKGYVLSGADDVL